MKMNLSEYTTKELRQMVIDLDTPDFDVNTLHTKFEYLDEIRTRKDWKD